MKLLESEPETTVWLEEVPSHLFWEGEWWRVLDMPRRVLLTPAGGRRSSRVASVLPGWHFRASSESEGETKTFEVMQLVPAGWQVVRAVG